MLVKFTPLDKYNSHSVYFVVNDYPFRYVCMVQLLEISWNIILATEQALAARSCDTEETETMGREQGCQILLGT
jgi:hypothetical protein